MSDNMKLDFEHAMPSLECAKWILSSTMSKRNETWIGSRFELLGIYLSYYCPLLWRLIWNHCGMAKYIYNMHKPEGQNSTNLIVTRFLG